MHSYVSSRLNPSTSAISVTTQPWPLRREQPRLVLPLSFVASPAWTDHVINRLRRIGPIIVRSRTDRFFVAACPSTTKLSIRHRKNIGQKNEARLDGEVVAPPFLRSLAPRLRFSTGAALCSRSREARRWWTGGGAGSSSSRVSPDDDQCSAYGHLPTVARLGAGRRQGISRGGTCGGLGIGQGCGA